VFSADFSELGVGWEFAGGRVWLLERVAADYDGAGGEREHVITEKGRNGPWQISTRPHP
jgi:hypothetical protein